MINMLYSLWSLLIYGERFDVSSSNFKTASYELIDYVFNWTQNLFGDAAISNLGSFSTSVSIDIPCLILAWVTGLSFLIGLVSLIFRVFQLKRVF